MSIFDYVETEFGTNSKAKLKRISIGGNSNQKGNKYEDYFAVTKVCLAISQAITICDFDNYYVSSQEVAFIDDICYQIKNIGYKTNYQAKNSSGKAASWTKEIEERCKKQLNIDLKFHKANTSMNVLLVSSRGKCKNNKKKIPIQMNTYCSCEFFPYFNNSISLILSHKELRESLEIICADNNIQTLDTAFRCLYSVWGTTDPSEKCSVGDILRKAKDMSKPNIFCGFLPEMSIPSWLIEKCATFQNCQASIESGKIYVRYNGLELMVENLPQTLTPELEVVVKQITTLESFMRLLIDFTGKNLV
ncbi:MULTISPECIES: hypothetical protein [Providencia]|uniref:hypothetical protein n=1 Tax=Providencia TaxID=586 RepID=UPI00234BF1D7|nr:hypothetical protein [Providencia sp. PROV266]